jgi:hypothetical protein
MTIAKINDERVSKIVIATCNKVGGDSDLKQEIENLRHALCINPELVLQTLARTIVTRKIPSSFNIEDKSFHQFVDLVTKTFSGSENGFKDQICLNDSLAIFFANNTNIIATPNELLLQFINCAIEIAFNSVSEYKHLELEALGILIGAFANQNLLLDVYESFIENCLDPQKDIYSILTDEARIRMAIRAIFHAKKMTNELKKSLVTFPKINGFITSSITNLTNSEDITISQKRIVSNENKEKVNKINVDKIEFFSCLTAKGVSEDDIDIVDDIKSILSAHPEQRSEIIIRIFYCLLEQITPKTFFLIDIIMKQLLSVINKNEIPVDEFEDELLEEMEIDIPKVRDTWTRINKAISRVI